MKIKIFLLLLLFISLVIPSIVLAEDIYIAQSTNGLDTGVNCVNAHAFAWINTASNWNNLKQIGKIGPGDTIHLCGTITGAPGSSILILQGSGMAGKPITLIFEPGAVLQAPYFHPNGAINTNSNSYITIDGGTNGIIQNTDNGTALTYKSISAGIVGNVCNNCEIKNLTIRNIYVQQKNDTTVDQTRVNCISINGSNISIHDNICHDAGWGIGMGYNANDDNNRIYNNDIYNIDHGFALASSGSNHIGNVYFYNNHVHDYANWDTATNKYHHDGIHAFGVYANGSCPVVSHFWIYNNIFDGNVGVNLTGHVFLEGGTCGAGGTPWTDSTGTAHIFNNIFKNAYVGVSKGIAHEIYNNSFIGNSGLPVCLGVGSSSDYRIKNNFISGCNQLISLSGPSIDGSYVDYNVYANCIGSYNCWGQYGSNFTQYQTEFNNDAHSVNNINNIMSGLTSVGYPLDGSAVIKAGTNLTSLGITALNFDKSGRARPSSGAWDVGAYNAVFNRLMPPNFKSLK